MKRFILIACLLAAATAVKAQKLVIGDRAPELKVKEWYGTAPKTENLPRFIEFFYSQSQPSLGRLPVLGALADRYTGKINFVVVCRESAEKIASLFGPAPRSYFLAIDDAGKSFAAYEVQYIPFGVLVDAKGRIVWFGNPETLGEEELSKVVK